MKKERAAVTSFQLSGLEGTSVHICTLGGLACMDEGKTTIFAKIVDIITEREKYKVLNTKSLYFL